MSKRMIRGLQLAATTAALTLMAACSSPQPADLTVTEALAAPDETKVVITAAVVQQISSERFLLSDGTGQIMADIDDNLLGRIQLPPDARLRIYGELDRDDEGTTIEAETVQVVQ